ncbi:DnaD domain-containing protein [Chloroflexota bacterium]
MTEFSGFPARTKYTPIPNSFFSTLLPHIRDMAELKTTLHLFWLLYQKKGYPRFVSHNELLSDSLLLEGIGDAGRLLGALQAVVRLGVLLHLMVERAGEAHHLYFINNEEGRRAHARIERGELELGALVKTELAQDRMPAQGAAKSSIFTLYEQNIGLLNPLIVEELEEAEKLYPQSWIEDAFREAVSQNVRRWRYIVRILEDWAREGKQHGEPGRYSKAGVDPKEYLRWRRPEADASSREYPRR